MTQWQDEDSRLRSVALQNASTIFAARQRAEQELIAAKEALRESEERLRAVFNQAAVGIAVADLDGRFEQANRRFLEIVGCSAAELQQCTFLDITQPADLSQAPLQPLLDGQAAEYVHEKRLVRKDGSGVWILSTVALLKDAAGRPRQFIGVIEDITERKQAEAALCRSEEFNRSIVDSSRDCIKVLDLEGRLLMMASGGQQMLCIPDIQPFLNRSWIDFWQESDREPARAAVQRAGAGGSGHFIGQCSTPAGETRWWDVLVTPILDAAGRPDRLLAVSRDITEAKRAEQALQAQERELSLIYTSVTDAIFSVAVEAGGRYRFLSVNPAFLTAFGLSSEVAVAGRLVHEVLPDSIRLLMLRNSAAAIREHRTVRWEEAWESPAGRRAGLVSVTPVFDADRNCVQLIGTLHDITERHREEELRIRLAAVVESSDDAIVSKTLEGIITTWNQGAERMFGYTAQEAVGQPIQILIPPDRINEENEILARLKRGERIEHYETVRIRKDGTPLDISLSISPIRDSSGKTIGASKIARDITLRRLMEEALRDESRMLDLLNRTGSMIASQLDLQTLVQLVTDAATQLSGARFGAFFHNVTEPQGEAFSLYTLSGAPREAFEKFGLPRNTPLFGPTFRGEAVVRLADVTCDPRYGTMAPHHGMPRGHLPVRSYLAVPVVSRSGQVIGGLFFGHPEANVFTERTERLIVGVAAQAAVAIDNAQLYEHVRTAALEREQLLEAERTARTEAERVSLMKDEFLATLSHELRTPLNAILGWAQILRSREHQDEELAEGLSVIERNTKVQAQLIEDLLDMSRIISGKIRLDVQQVELQDVVKAAVASVRHSADAKDIRLQIVLDPLAGPVRGDPGRLQQCFWNLLSNAIKFTPKGGRVQVALEQADSHVEVCVTDNGQGIKPEFLPHLFERFRQADASTTRRHGGLGLGLSIVKHLVELHGGKVWARSPGEGQGATFCVEFPMMVLHAPDDPNPREHPRSPVLKTTSIDHPSLEGISVLVVDDEPDARNLISRVLTDCGAKVILAASTQEALSLLTRERPDMIISDIGMPGEDGYQFIRKVRALSADEGGRTPAAALTAFARAEDRTRALRAGYQTHVTKPVEPTELTAVVASLAVRR